MKNLDNTKIILREIAIRIKKDSEKDVLPDFDFAWSLGQLNLLFELEFVDKVDYHEQEHLLRLKNLKYKKLVEKLGM